MKWPGGSRAAVFLILAVMGCASADVPDTSEDRPLPWTFERQWSFGGAAQEGASLSTLYRNEIAPDAHGNLWIVDEAEFRVLQLDSLGRLARTAGREGKGPGELSRPIEIAVADDGAVHVRDIVKRLVVVFGPDGSVQPEYRPTTLVQQFRLLNNGWTVGTRGRIDTVRLLMTRGDSAVELMRYLPPSARKIPQVCNLSEYDAQPIFAADLVWNARSDQVVAATDEFRISVFQDGQVKRVLSRTTPRRQSTADMARSQLGEGATIQILGFPKCVIPASAILEVAEISPLLPAYSALLLGPDNLLLAMRYVARGEPATADVYDLISGYQGTIALGDVNPVGFLSTGAVISLERDADDVPLVSAYTIRKR